MTLENNEPVVIYTGDGVTTIFDYGFRVDEVEDFYITVVNESDGVLVSGPLVLGSFGFTGLGEQDGGTIEYPLSGDPLAAIYKIVIRRLTNATQGLEISTQSAPTVALEDQLDEIVEKIQELQAELDQAYKANFGEVPGDLSDAMDAVLAAAATVTALTLGNVASATHAAVADASPQAGDEYPLYEFTSGALRKRTQAALDAYYDAKYVAAGSYQPLDADLTALGSFGMSAFAGLLWGCTCSNAADTVNDITIAAGKCIDSTNAALITCAAMTKRLDAGWAPGTTNGMRNSAVAITNTTYHIYAVSKADGTQDYYAHTSLTVATVITALQLEVGGGSYLYARRIFSIVRTAADGGIKQFSHLGDEILWKVPAADVAVVNLGAASVSYPLTVPLGLKVIALLGGLHNNASAGKALYLRSPDQDDVAVGSPAITSVNNVAGVVSNWYQDVRTDTSAQIAARADTASTTLSVFTRGYIDTRGRLA